MDDDDDDSPWNRCPWIRNKLKNGKVKIRNRGRIAKFLCDPGYELVGKRFATCVRGQWNHPVPVCVAQGCYKSAEVANGQMTEMYRGAVVLYDCNPGYTLEGPSTLYCDGRYWTSAVPSCVVATTNPQTSCDFEDPDLCGWSQDPTHDFDWKRNQFSTPSGHAGTGPSYDHTFGRGKGGFYLYQEASAPRKPNDVSRLFSPVYSTGQSGGCFLFWYHMFGSTIGALKVYIKPQSHVLGELDPSWELSSDQGDQWIRGNLSVPKFTENFQIVIEGIRGSNYIADTAIDDVYLTNLSCEAADNATDHIAELSSNSCKGRCREMENSSYCGCNDECHANGNCCFDFVTMCTGNVEKSENPSEEDIQTTKPSIMTSSSFNTEEISTVNNTLNLDISSTLLIENITEPSLSPITILPMQNTTLTSPTSTSQLTTLETTLPADTTTQYSTTTSTFPVVNITSTTFSSSTSSSSSITPLPNITVTSSTTTNIPSTTESTTFSTTTTTMFPITTTSNVPLTTISTRSTSISSIPPTITMLISSTFTPSEATTTSTIPSTIQTSTTNLLTSTSLTTKSSETSSFTFLSPSINPVTKSSSAVITSQRTTLSPTTSTRKTYNLRPRNRTTSTTTTTTTTTTARATTQTRRFSTQSSTSVYIPLSTTTSTQKPITFKTITSQNVESSTSLKEYSTNLIHTKVHQPVAAIISITLVMVVCLTAAVLYLIKRRSNKRQSKLSDDSEMRFLSENEIIDYSDSSALDKMLIH